jgi:hypothetical protein
MRLHGRKQCFDDDGDLLLSRTTASPPTYRGAVMARITITLFEDGIGRFLMSAFNRAAPGR